MTYSFKEKVKKNDDTSNITEVVAEEETLESDSSSDDEDSVQVFTSRKVSHSSKKRNTM